ncbi:MAG TPA: hypothetical protein VKU87_07590 [Thermomicrobiaceae bacterium]|nr:hypothetical protein [Thermomicrobiaceae bacterium]
MDEDIASVSLQVSAPVEQPVRPDFQLGTPGGAVAEPPARPEFQIVPLAGLPVVGVVLALLIAGIVSDRLWALDFLHVVGGLLWTAIDLFVGFVIGPIIGRLSVPARVEFSKWFMPRMLLIMPTLVTVTLAAGWQIGRHLGYVAMPYPMHWWLTASYIVVGVLSVVALGILEPANLAVLFELRKPRPDGELISKLMRRFVYTAGVTGVMQIAILIIMTRIATW